MKSVRCSVKGCNKFAIQSRSYVWVWGMYTINAVCVGHILESNISARKSGLEGETQ